MKRANIRKRLYTKNGKTQEIWVVDYYDLNGKRRQHEEKNKRHAEAWAAKVDREIHDGVHVAKSDNIKFGKCFKEWMEHNQTRHRLKGIWGGTLKGFDFSAKHILPYFERRPLNKITSPEVEKFVHQLLSSQARSRARFFHRRAFTTLSVIWGNFLSSVSARNDCRAIHW